MRSPSTIWEDMAVAGRGVAGTREGTRGSFAVDKFTVVIELAGLNSIELSTYCREPDL